MVNELENARDGIDKQNCPLRSWSDRSGLSRPARWSACLNIDRLGGLYDLSRLFDSEMQHTLVEMSLDSCVLRFEWQAKSRSA